MWLTYQMSKSALQGSALSLFLATVAMLTLLVWICKLGDKCSGVKKKKAKKKNLTTKQHFPSVLWWRNIKHQYLDTIHQYSA